MARKKIFSRTTTIVIAGLIIVAVAYSMINFGNLSISDPFVTENFGFQATDMAFMMVAPTTTTTSTTTTTTSTTCLSPKVLVNGICKTPPENLRLADYIKPTSGTTGFFYLCKLKLHTDVKLQNNAGIIRLDSEFQEVAPLFPLFSVATSSLKLIDSFDTEPRLTCDVIIATDGRRLPVKVTSSNLQLIVDSYNAQGIRFLTKSNTIGLGTIDFVDSPTTNTYIGSERPVGSKITTTALEIENKLGGTTSFDARVNFHVIGTIIIEVPELSKYTTTPFKTKLEINQNILTNSMSLKILKGTTQAPSDVTPFLEITEVRPPIVITDGKVGSTELLQVFSKLNNWNQNEGTPLCTARKLIVTSEVFLGSIGTTGATFSSASVLRSSDGINSFFECRLFIPADSLLGKYEIKVKTQASNRPTAVNSFTLAKSTSTTDGTTTGTDGTTTGIDGTTTGETRPCYDCQGTFLKSVSKDQQCPYFECEGGRTVGGTGGVPICSDGQPASKTGTGTYTCQRSDGTDTGTPTLFPKFVECPAGVTANVSQSEICADPLIIWIFTGFNFVFVIFGIIVFLLIIGIIASAIKGRSSI